MLIPTLIMTYIWIIISIAVLPLGALASPLIYALWIETLDGRIKRIK